MSCQPSSKVLCICVNSLCPADRHSAWQGAACKQCVQVFLLKHATLCRQPFLIETPEGPIAWALCGPCTLLASACFAALHAGCLCFLEYVLARRPLAALSMLVRNKHSAVIVSTGCTIETSHALLRKSSLIIAQNNSTVTVQWGALQVQYSRCTACQDCE